MQPTMSTTPLPDTPANPAIMLSTLIASLVARSILSHTSNHSISNTSNTNFPVPISVQDKKVEVLTPCTRQHDKFVDPTGKLLQPGTVIFCKDLPFVVSNNGIIYNYMAGNMKRLYIADPSGHKYLVKQAYRSTTFSSILGSVLVMSPGFHKEQQNALHNRLHQLSGYW